MAWKKLQSKSDTLSLDATNKSVVGFLVGIQRNVGKFKSNIYTLRAPDGSEQKVWGNASLDSFLTRGQRIAPELAGVMVRLAFVGFQKIRGRKQKMRVCSVEADFVKNLHRPGKANSVHKAA